MDFFAIPLGDDWVFRTNGHVLNRGFYPPIVDAVNALAAAPTEAADPPHIMRLLHRSTSVSGWTADSATLWKPVMILG